MSHAEQIEALKGLLERVRDATGADRRLDYELFRAFAEKDAANHWDPKAGHFYTASVDEALALVERQFPQTWHEVLRNGLSDLGRRHDWHMCFARPGQRDELPRAIVRRLVLAKLALLTQEETEARPAERSLTRDEQHLMAKAMRASTKHVADIPAPLPETQSENTGG